MTMFFRNGKVRDHGAVMLDGVRAVSMTREAVFDAMTRKHVPGIASTMGRQQLIDILIDWQTMYPEKPEPRVMVRPKPDEPPPRAA
jgi:hypothetical protein